MIRAVRVMLVAIALALAWVFLLYYAAIARLMFDDLNMNDFGKFYYSARQFLEGGNMYAPNPATLMPVGGGRTHQFLNMNPPHFHLPLLPLARLSPAGALTGWAIGSLVALVASIGLMAAELRLRPTVLQSAWLLTALLAFAGTGTAIITGQVSFFLMLMATLAWVAARRGRWRLSGVWLGLLMSVKPFTLLFVPWFVIRRQWTALTAAAIAAGLAFLTGLVVFGVDAHASWLDALESTDWTWAAMNASLLGAFSRWLGESPYYTAVLLAPGAIVPLWISTAVVAGTVTLIVAARAEGADGPDRAFAVLFAGALLVSPLGWVYYWWLPLAPIAALVRPRRTLWFWLALPWMFVPLALTVAGQPNGWVTFSLGSAYFWATLLVWLDLVLRRRP